MLHELGEVNPTQAYYNGSRTSKDEEDSGWGTSMKTRRRRRHPQHWKHLGRLYFVVFALLRNIVIPRLVVCRIDEAYPALPRSMQNQPLPP
ncbi:hypothetical protein Tco_1395461 [Tanacetum coccineum]